MEIAFLHDLKTWGPDASREQTPSRAEAEAYCRRLARTHYENFPVVSWMLPRPLHQHFYNVYAYCRWADDLGDEVNSPAESLRLLSWWRDELRACYDGEARHPVFVALASTIEQFHIPAGPLEDLISAFEQDQGVHEYETFQQLRDYCRRSADPVGRLVLHVCGSYNERNVAWSDSICTGLQLANFWQDVARDLDIGRVYLPKEDRDRFDYRRDDLDARLTNDAFVRLMEFEVGRAREFLTAGLPLAEHLPGRLQVAIDLFARSGLTILDRIEAIDYRVWDTRPVVSKSDVMSVTMGCLVRAIRRRFRFRR